MFIFRIKTLVAFFNKENWQHCTKKIRKCKTKTFIKNFLTKKHEYFELLL